MKKKNKRQLVYKNGKLSYADGGLLNKIDVSKAAGLATRLGFDTMFSPIGVPLEVFGGGKMIQKIGSGVFDSSKNTWNTIKGNQTFEEGLANQANTLIGGTNNLTNDGTGVLQNIASKATMLLSDGGCIDCEDQKSGGWIKGAIKHPGRCSSPGDSRCPKGSPQYNLAMRFKHGDLHKHGDGGPVEQTPYNSTYVPTPNGTALPFNIAYVTTNKDSSSNYTPNGKLFESLKDQNMNKNANVNDKLHQFYSKPIMWRKDGGSTSPNARVEKGEYVIAPNQPQVTRGQNLTKISGKDLIGSISKVNGGTHKSGNDTDIMANGGFIVSNNLKYNDKKTYAEKLKPTMSAVSRLEKFKNKYGHNTPEQKAELERHSQAIKSIVKMNAQHKDAIDQEKIMRSGGYIPTYRHGTGSNPIESTVGDYSQAGGNNSFALGENTDTFMERTLGAGYTPNNDIDPNYTPSDLTEQKPDINYSGVLPEQNNKVVDFSPNPTPKGLDYKNLLSNMKGIGNLGIGAASMAANIPAMFNRFDTPMGYNRYQPRYGSGITARNDLKRMYNTSLSQLRNSGYYGTQAHNALYQSYLDKMNQLNTGVENANTDIYNKGQDINVNIGMKEQDANQADIGRTRDIRRAGLQQAIVNPQNARKDYRQENITSGLYDSMMNYYNRQNSQNA